MLEKINLLLFTLLPNLFAKRLLFCYNKKIIPMYFEVTMENPHTGKQTNLEVPADLFFSAVIRDFSKDIFQLAGFNGSWQNKLKLVTDELFMNAVRYGSSEKENVYLHYKILDSGVSFTIEDTGTGVNGCDAEDLQQKIDAQKTNTDLTKISGRGLAMFTKEWSDEFEVSKSDHGGTKINFVKYLPLDKIAEQEAEGKKFKQMGKQISIKFSGEIDQFNIGDKIKDIEEVLKKDLTDTEVILDFSKVTYINSTFIGHLASFYTKLQKKKGQLKIVGVDDNLYEILNLVGLNKIVEVVRIK